MSLPSGHSLAKSILCPSQQHIIDNIIFQDKLDFLSVGILASENKVKIVSSAEVNCRCPALKIFSLCDLIHCLSPLSYQTKNVGRGPSKAA